MKKSNINGDKKMAGLSKTAVRSLGDKGLGIKADDRAILQFSNGLWTAWSYSRGNIIKQRRLTCDTTIEGCMRKLIRKGYIVVNPDGKTPVGLVP